MQKKNCFFVGTVFKLHGYKGDVKIYNKNNILLDFNSINYFLIEKENTLIPFFISKARHTQKNIILVKFEELNSKENALSILKQAVYIPTKYLPKIDQNKNSKNELIGFNVIDCELGQLGKITYINSQTTQKLIFVNNKTKEFCFPMHKQFIINIDSEKKIMNVKIPEELLNLN